MIGLYTYNILLCTSRILHLHSCPHLVNVLIRVGIFLTRSCRPMEQIGICRQRKRNSSISSLNSELYIDPDNDLRDPIFSGGESTDDECDEVAKLCLEWICEYCEWMWLCIYKVVVSIGSQEILFVRVSPGHGKLWNLLRIFQTRKIMENDCKSWNFYNCLHRLLAMI